MELEYYEQIVEKSLNVKLHENSSSGSRVFASGKRGDHMDRRNITDKRKLIFAFRNFGIKPNNLS
jgi:hypothetical protein